MAVTANNFSLPGKQSKVFRYRPIFQALIDNFPSNLIDKPLNDKPEFNSVCGSMELIPSTAIPAIHIPILLL